MSTSSVCEYEVLSPLWFDALPAALVCSWHAVEVFEVRAQGLWGLLRIGLLQWGQ